MKSLGAYKEKYRHLLMTNGWGFGGKVMPKNSWTAWKEAVTALLECMYVYYYRTYEKAVRGGREGKRRTCAKGHH